MNPRARSTASYVAGLLLVSSIGVVGAQSCVFDETGTTLCSSGIRCRIGWECAAAQPVCINNGCGDGFVDRAAGETCDDGNIIDDEVCSADCKTSPSCGNGRKDGNEVCDNDTTNTSGDGCSADCASLEVCGNGYRDVDEVCDDGNTDGGDGCRPDCQGIDTCGNEQLDMGEVCDNDRTNTSGDGCSADCLSNESCGNGYKDVEEDCDDGHEDTHECNAHDCTIPECGDRYVNPAFINPESNMPEECDEGGENEATCNANCTYPRCGDGFTNDQFLVEPEDPDAGVEPHAEECDDGEDNSDDEPLACREGCTLPVCGDGVADSGARDDGSIFTEECDDGDNNDNDAPLACRTGCELPSCGDDVTDNGSRDDGHVFDETCDDGNTSNTDACPSGEGGKCQTARCGDGFVRSGAEDCDDGENNSNTVPLACRSGCTLPKCGDHVTDHGVREGGQVFSEECDDGNTDNTDACVSGDAGPCRNAICGDGFIRTGVEQCDPQRKPAGCPEQSSCNTACQCI